MAIAYGTPGTRYLTAVANTSKPVAYPATIAAGDLLLLHMITNGGVVTLPSGWTEIYRETTMSNPKGIICIKVADGTETGTLAVTTASSTGNAQMYVFTGVDVVTPQDVAATVVQNTVAGTTTVLPTMTTITADTMLVYANGGNSSTVTMTCGTGTERQDHAQTGGSGSKGGAIYTEPLTATGATGSRTITLSASRENFGAMIALRPSSTLTVCTAVGIASSEALGTPSATTGAISPVNTGIASAEAFGTPSVTLGAITATASGISSAEAFGTPNAIIEGGDILATAVGIPSAEAFGTPSRALTAVTCTAGGISSSEAFGIPTAFVDIVFDLPRPVSEYSVADLEFEFYSRQSGLERYHTINDHKYYFYKARLGNIEGTLDDLEYEWFKTLSLLPDEGFSLADHKIATFEQYTPGNFNDDGRTYYSQYFI